MWNSNNANNVNAKDCNDRNCDRRPLVEYLDIHESDIIETHILESEVLCVHAGRLKLSFDNVDNLEVGKGGMVLLPQNCRLRLTAMSQTMLLVLRMRYGIVSFDQFSFEQIIEDTPMPEKKISAIGTCPEIEDFMDNLAARIKDGVDSGYYFELKLKEYLFLLMRYYPQDTLSVFFYSLMGSNSAFVEFVNNHHSKVHTVIEFAKLANYSLSGFEKRFRRVFGMSPYRWMNAERAKNILYDLHNTSKSFCQMKDEYGFSSLSHFNDFCKKSFGNPPGRVRRQLGS